MNIPVSFKKIIEKNQRLNGIVNYTISQYDTILRENNLYFFEEYTDHGIKHIESVLTSTVNIVPKETQELFLQDDSSSVSIYVLATILHDIGMHITPEGFYSLVSGEYDDLRVTEIDNKTWKELWNDYLDDARRFGDIEKKNIIGNPSWDFKIPEIENKDKLTGEDKKLIGEFIRRNHPRIAHEIALRGFPTKQGHIAFASELDYDLRNLCGLVARSHGVNIRSLFEYLELKFQDTWAKPYNIEIIYLMILLRIADYFQIDSARTPEVTVKLKSFNSPISQIEHFKHLDVKYVQPYNKDPETLILQCEPRNSYIFIKLKELFEDIQKELDKSWAILGEIYGKELKEKQPKICYRRIKSNIDNVNEYSKKVNYIPEKIVFNVSNELPKLLIGPLYGNDPTYGVRELLQNAVDSCREREFLENSEYTGLVKISLYSEADKYFFKIEDNGFGMNLGVIKNYFLEVGSSLRKSSIWKKNFSNKEGQSKIQRSGRFGIGVLASFLLGNKLCLETKDSNSSNGLSFTTDLNSEQIEITKIKKESVGTTIIIQIEKEVLEELKNSSYSFDKWYLQNNPKVEYFDKTGTFTEFGDIEKTPGFTDELIASSWRELKVDGFNKIIWTYDKSFCKKMYGSTRSGKFISNGILIPKVKSFSWNDITIPFISVFDFDGNLPLNLSRNDLDSGVIPFQKKLKLEIYKDIIAKLLNTKIEFPLNIEKFKNQTFYHPAIGDIKLAFSKEGFILKEKFFSEKNSKRTILYFFPKTGFKSFENFDIKDAFIYLRNEEDLAMTSFQYNANIREYNGGAKLYISRPMYNKLFDNNYNRYPKAVRRDHIELNSDSDFTEISYNYPASSSELNLNDLKNNLHQCNCIIESKLKTIDDSIGKNSSKIFSELLNKYFNKISIIPYSLQERKETFNLAFSELDYYMKKYTD
ncbi:HD domain-containing protein [Zobellia alginiliquefaciens]|uniref:HD domain-containing protein n=1 Tax=Zobellia alginiliquefaciens TaxID=3032586 RepID=UPI0023E3F30E|nr:ATP-binding protein [Zobellia alginiliquefaciens]